LSYRIIHIADVHLDMAFRGLDPAVGDTRRKQLEAAFQRALDLAKERRADALCIAGDLYESDRASPDRGAYLERVLGALAPMRVFISPGNHDPNDRPSLYRQMALPSNVTVFRTRRFEPVRLAEGLTLWGAGHEFELDRDPILRGFECTGPGTHVLLFHGSDREKLPPGKECIAPFTDAEIARTGASHAMVGHFHSQLQGKRYAYPGSPEPLGAAQNGRHTASLLTIDGGLVDVSFIDLNRTRYVTADFDVSPYGDRSALSGAVAASLRAIGTQSGEVFPRVRLIGNASPSLDLDGAELQRDLQAEFPGAVVEEAYAAVDPQEAAREGYTVRAEFAREMMRRIAQASEEQRPELELALRYGLLAFAGKKLAP
jgi:DNA repair exonuclease SbcCD nuclease subunit